MRQKPSKTCVSHPRCRLEKLKGPRSGQHSIRVNVQWRICFAWNDGDATDVEIVDYLDLLMTTTRKLAPIHPGEILLEDFLEPMGISQYRLAQDISVPPRRINEIVHESRRIRADTALRFARYFGTTERFWLNLQSRFDLEEQKDLLGNRLAKEVLVLRAAS